jgi:hypothetical protein
MRRGFLKVSISGKSGTQSSVGGQQHSAELPGHFHALILLPFQI